MLKEKVKKAKYGDEKAFLELMNECKESLYRTAYSYVKNEAEALELVQETVYKAYISIDKLKKEEFFKTWITRILINNAITHMKKKEKIIYLNDSSFFDKEDTKDDFKVLDERMYLWKAVDSLEEKYREVIVLKYFNDMTIKEIAEFLDYPIGTVKTYLNKALVRLRKFVEKDVI
ncbi:MAG: sigma-70 family RNA polymerase sigma factor [Sarcina sp.]